LSEESLFHHTLDTRDQGKKLEDILYRRFRFSRKLLQRLKIGENVWLDGKTVYLSTRGQSGQVLTVNLFEAEDVSIQGEDLPLDILFEDLFFLAVNKPPGQIVHPVGPHVKGTLANAVIGYWERQGQIRPFRPVFRIDRNTSGLVLIAKNRFAHQQLTLLFHSGMVRKFYLGLVGGILPSDAESGLIDLPIGVRPGSKIVREIHPAGQQAQTEYQTLAAAADCSLVAFRPRTGRTHQIRVHCQAIGHPLLGDDLYHGDCTLMSRQALHAYRYSFVHPFTKAELELTAPLPADIEFFLAQRFDPALIERLKI